MIIEEQAIEAEAEAPGDRPSPPRLSAALQASHFLPWLLDRSVEFERGAITFTPPVLNLLSFHETGILLPILKRTSIATVAGLLRGLWDAIVDAVVRNLEPHVPKNSRVWWCPTGGAWTVGHLRLVVHAYAFRPHPGPDQAERIAGYSQFCIHRTAKRSWLQSVRQELDKVHQLLPESVQFTELIDEAATREAVLTALRTHTFAHLACHGQQVAERPYDSHFAMHDGRLTLLDIVHSQVGHETEFAFLSACKTATGDVDAPDEVIHLAAALQFAGVGNVVGTMWSVDDQVVVYTVEAFYRAMVREDGVFDSSRAARALRAATRATKDRVPLDQRIVFIHIGV
ncbi:CHAT domain-containing protein [Boletus edulis BED1]|uniref:CHAT domain-containing protein n=1 Tax=Boletus edulis BED1 TaxID=1328754 RepID=A0AAD4BY29_BOLED|nr:CHAT domain-containing protein [Boletus edulis BED1]